MAQFFRHGVTRLRLWNGWRQPLPPAACPMTSKFVPTYRSRIAADFQLIAHESREMRKFDCENFSGLSQFDAVTSVAFSCLAGVLHCAA